MQFDWTTFALEILNFLVLVWILKRFLYQPVLALLDGRRQHIQAEMDRAATTLAEANTLRAQYESRLDEWGQERERERRKLEEEMIQARAAGMDTLKRTLADEEAKARARDAMQTSAREAALARQAHETAYGDAAAMLKRLASPSLTHDIAQVLLEDLASLPETDRAALHNAAEALAPGAAASVVSAHELDAASREALKSALSAAAGKTLFVDFRTDAALIAGLSAAIGECQLHANLSDELAFFSKAGNHAR